MDNKNQNQLIELVHAVGINISEETAPELFKHLNGVIDDIHGL
jgi:ribosomal protein L12E/L44/L45/RPP1/RPP2